MGKDRQIDTFYIEIAMLLETQKEEEKEIERKREKEYVNSKTKIRNTETNRLAESKQRNVKLFF
jgi:hypothetical protein